MPYAFTEHGTIMLANVLNSEKAIEVSVQIVETYVAMREMLIGNLSLKLEIEEIKKKLSNHSNNIELVFSYLDELIEKKNQPRKAIGYKTKHK